ncbi:YhdP family phospholipid transporter [Galenea microaerophila]
MWKRVLHWSWRLFETAVLLLLFLFVLLQGTLYFFQYAPQKSSALLQKYLGIGLTYQQADIQQNLFSFTVTAKQLKVQRQATYFQAEQLTFDIHLLSLLTPSQFVGDHLVLRNARLQLPPIDLYQDAQKSAALNRLPARFWREISVSNFELATQLRQTDLSTATPLSMKLTQLQSRQGLDWLLNGRADLYVASQMPVTRLSVQGRLKPNAIGFLSKAQLSWQFIQPLDLAKLRPLLNQQQRGLLPLGSLAVDGEATLQQGKLRALTSKVSFQQLQWPNIKHNQVLPKSLAFRVRWLQAQAQRAVLEDLTIDNRYVGHQNLAEVVLGPEAFQLKMSQFSSAPFEPILKKALEEYLKVPVKTLAEQPPHIDIDAIQLSLNYQTWKIQQLALRLNQLSVPSIAKYPGVKVQHLFLQKLGMHYQLNVKKPIQIQYPDAFEQPIALKFDKKLQFSWQGGRQQKLQIPKATFHVNQIPFQLQWTSTGSVVKQAVLSASPKTLSEVKALLPYPLMSKQLQQWLKQSLKAGEQIQVVAKLSGDLKRFPFKKGGGTLQAKAVIHHTVLKFQPDWPALTDFTAQLDFRPYDLTVTTPKATLSGLQVSDVKALIANLDQKDIAVAIRGKAQGDAADAQRFLLESPLAKKAGLETFLQKQVTFSGRLEADLKRIWVPVYGFDQQKEDVQANVFLKGVDLTLYQKLPFKNIQGDISIHNHDIQAPNLKGQLTGVPFSAKIQTEPKKHQVTISATGALQMPRESLLVKGRLPWEYYAILPYDQRPIKMKTQVDFNQFHSKLPAPLDQSFFSTGPAEFTFEKNHAHGKLDFHLGQSLKAKGKLDFSAQAKKAQTNLIQALYIAIGQQTVPKNWSEVKGVRFQGSLNTLDLDGWLHNISEVKSWFPTMESSSEHPILFAPSTLDFKTVRYKNHAYQDLALTLQTLSNQQQVFKLKTAKEIDLQGIKQAGKWQVYANKLHVILPESAKASEKSSISKSCQPPLPPQSPLNLAPIYFKGKNIRWGSRQFDRMSFHFAPTLKALLVQDLNFGYRKAYGTGYYQWQYDVQKSDLKIAIHSKSVEDFSRMLDIEKGITGKKAELNLKASWRGGPHCFDLKTVRGDLNVRYDDGVIKDVEPGIARVLGLLSINSIVRRLSLNLSDVTDKGLAYSIIEANGKIEKGYLKLKELKLEAPSVRGKVWGRVDLIHKKLDLKADVTPAVGSSLATIGALVGAVNPITAILTFTLLKNIPQINEDLITYQYTVRGDWEKPIIKERSAGVQLIHN